MRKKTSVKPEGDEEMFKPNKDCWAAEIRDLVTNFESEGETLDLVLKKIRRKTFKYYEIGYEQMRMRPSFKPIESMAVSRAAPNRSDGISL